MSGGLSLWAWSHGRYPGREMPRQMLPGLSSVGLWDARSPQPWGLDWHYNEGLELTYVLRGKVPFSVDDKTYLLRPGQMTITRPWQRHRVGNPRLPPSSLVWFIVDVGVRRPNQTWKWPPWLLFSADDREALTLLLRQNEEPCWDVDKSVRDRFRALAEALRCEKAEQISTRIAVSINDLLLEVLDNFSLAGIDQDPSLCSTNRAVAIFLEGLKESYPEPWTLDSMAGACGLGRTQFSRYCKEIVNMTPLEYLQWCRVEASKELLSRSGDLSITEVAFRAGFNSSQYFATVFRGITGTSPGSFRGSTFGPTK